MANTGGLRAAVVALVESLDPATLTGDDAVRVVEDLAVIEKVAAAGRMLTAARAAASDAWRSQGHGSATDWLASVSGLTVYAAAGQLATAKRVGTLPTTEAAMRSGELSVTQAAAVADAATADPGAEDELLESARHDTTATLKDKAAKVKAAATDTDERERRIRSERFLRTRTDADGAFCLSLRGPAVDGVALHALLRPFQEMQFRTGRTDGTRDRYENRAYDAFFAMLAHHARPAPAETSPTEPAPASGSTEPPAAEGSTDGASTTAPSEGVPAPLATTPNPPARLPGGNNVKVIVRIDHTALARGHTVAGETCEVAGLGPISVATAREMMADAFLAAVITRGRDVINVAHLGRALNAHQRTAIEAMGLRCYNRACNHDIALQMDHCVPWVEVLETRLENQDPLCPACHRLKTHHGWHLEPGRGPRRFLPPDRERSAHPPSEARGDPPCVDPASTDVVGPP